jgi:hypothetical protein
MHGNTINMGVPLFFFVEAVCLACVLHASSGFVPTLTNPKTTHSYCRTHDIIKKSSTERSRYHTAFMSIFDDVGKFFSGLNSNNNGTTPNQPKFEVADVEDVDGVYTGSKRIITIPGES